MLIVLAGRELTYAAAATATGHLQQFGDVPAVCRHARDAPNQARRQQTAVDGPGCCRTCEGRATIGARELGQEAIASSTPHEPPMHVLVDERRLA
jgi:hypothetical protein